MSVSSTFLRITIVATAIALVTLFVLAGADPAQELSVATKIYVG